MRNIVICIFVLISIMLNSCSNKQTVDLIVIVSKIESLDSAMNTYEAMVVDSGLIIDLGSTEDILSKYKTRDLFLSPKQFVYPGFYDAHCHFYGLALQEMQVDLKGSTSFEEILKRISDFDSINQVDWIVGRGWDQNLWDIKEFPNNQSLNELYPEKPVVLVRVDGHALLANEAALNEIGLTAENAKGNQEVIFIDGELSGILLENTADKLKAVIPDFSITQQKQALIQAEKILIQNGLTTIADAGLNQDKINVLRELKDSNQLKISIYQMLSSSEGSYEFIRNNGLIDSKGFHIGSIKIYADGALGSRGARLLEPYHDDHGNMGIVVTDPNEMRSICALADSFGYQVNTHAIGDGAARMVLDVYAEFLEEGNDKRWRIEHAQVVHPEDQMRFKELNVVPAINTTHATSDMGWAEDRLGPDRIHYAYAYKSLLNQNNWLCNGSDFPIEDVNPLYGLYAAVSRTDIDGNPKGGWMPEEALSREEALLAMTRWAAKACFEEDVKGSLEIGKKADFIVMDIDLLNCEVELIPKVAVKATYINGEQLHIIKRRKPKSNQED